MIDAIVRVSFQSESTANQAVSFALTGHKMATTSVPFSKLKNTAVYHCPNGTDAEVLDALTRLCAALKENAPVLDFVSITLVRTAQATPASAN